MARGMFTQCLAVLFKEAPPLEAVEAALAGFDINGTHAATSHWALGGPSVSLKYRPEVNGLVFADVVDQRWPDHMGDPQKDPNLFSAWTMGHFGPIADADSLLRATQQCWGWKEGKAIALTHRGFVRVRPTYVLGAADNAATVPADWNAVTELTYLTKVVEALLQVPGALCYFNPNGEMLRDLKGVQSQLKQAAADDLLLIDLWCNVRIYPFHADWTMMDTVGNGQFNDATSVTSEVRDIEAVFRTKQYVAGEVDGFVRDMTLYLHAEGDVIKDGDTLDGPGNVQWRATLLDQSVAMPPRRVLHIVPMDGVEPPAKPA